MRLLFAALMLIGFDALAHGNIDNKDGACTLKINEERAIHLTAYQPSTHEGEVFCQNAPDLVETIMVLDFMEEDSKKLPFAFSISYMNEEIIEPLASLPFKLYPQGSMLLRFIPEAIGKYHGKVMFLDEAGHDTSREFDFYVGELGPNSKESSKLQQTLKWLVITILLVGGAYFLFVRRLGKGEE